jgi:hypothetical protein
MLPFTGTNRNENSERILTFPVVILLLLMITFLGAGVYVLVSAMNN